jgi:hypothetical protein
MKKGPYTKPGRLSDVLALIQVLALDPDTKRSEEGMTKELQGPPASAEKWFAVAQEHREFFRVNPDLHSGLSLVSRYVLPKGNEDKRPPLSPEFSAALLQTAITIHDRQVSAAERWKSFLPLWAALIGGIFGTLSTLATLWLKGVCSN